MDGVVVSEGAFHMRERRLLQPAFHRDRIAHYGTIMADLALRRDAAAVQLDNALHPGQSDARARDAPDISSAMEAHKNLRQVGRRNAFTTIGDAQGLGTIRDIVALSGVPAVEETLSANVGQEIGFVIPLADAGTRLVFPSIDGSGTML